MSEHSLEDWMIWGKAESQKTPLKPIRVKYDLTGWKSGKLTVLSFYGRNDGGQALWLCQCECGNTTVAAGYNLKKHNNQGCTKSCGCNNWLNTNAKDLTNRRFGKLLAVKRVKSKQTKHGALAVWLCQCDCGNLCEKQAKILVSNRVTSCGCAAEDMYGSKHPCWTGCGAIPGAYWQAILHGAKARHLKVEINIEYAYELLVKQDFRCALTNLPITMGQIHSKIKPYEERTASFDRIDSSKHYLEGNMQWVHKLVQRMKNNIIQDVFIEFCALITKHADSKINS